MPAVTVDDILSLPTIGLTDDPAVERTVRSLTVAPAGFEGEGFPVRRAFAGVPMDRLDPFVHMDQMGEVEYGPGEPKGTPWHPHRGFETVTYMIDGIMEHQDSTGGGGVITDGDTQWMTAGSGLLHIEAPPAALVASGGLFHGLQLWVNLPATDKMIDPRYQDIRAERVTLLRSSDGGALVRVIAGRLGAAEGPGRTHTAMTMLHLTLSPGAQVTLPWDPAFNALAYVLGGAGRIGADGAAVGPAQLAVLDGGNRVTIEASAQQEARHPALEVVLLGGRPIGEPVAHHGPFVMNTRAELLQAFEDFQQGRMGHLPAGA